MLTQRQIEKILDSDWKIILKKGHHPRGYRGYYIPEKEEARIYLPAHKDKDDLAVTIIHEMIHIRNDEIRAARREETETHDDVEAEAQKTYRKNPEILEFIKKLYNLDI